MESTLGSLGRRKACDLCITKKIKCDSAKPKCSQCTIYAVDCLYTPGLAKPKTSVSSLESARKRKLINRYKDSSDSSLAARLAIVEAKLREAMLAQSAMTLGHDDAISLPSGTINPWSEDQTTHSRPTAGLHQVQLPLESLSVIMPVVDDFFRHFNTIVPLFDQPTFMHLLQEWFSTPQTRTAVRWAAINAVLGISIRNFGFEVASNEKKVLRCIRNIEAVLDDVVTSTRDLAGLQTVLCLIMLYQGTIDPRPATALVATAVRLAHRLRLHRKDDERAIAPPLGLQGNRVLWILYILDRDISMRAHDPYLLQDHDMDIDLPPLEPNDGAGVLCTATGDSCFNFLLCRIQLARIQSKMYDWLYSVRAERSGEMERQARLEQLNGMLSAWQGSIPASFRTEMDDSLPVGVKQQLVVMHFAYLYCLLKVNQVHVNSLENQWVRKFTEWTLRYAQAQAEDDPQAIELPPLPPKWQLCVDQARDCMALVRHVNPVDYAHIWQISCTHVASLNLLIVNKMNLFDDQGRQLDDLVRISATLAWLQHLGIESTEKRLVGLHRAYTELDKVFGQSVEAFLGLIADSEPSYAFASVLNAKARTPPPIPIENYIGTSRLDAPY